MTHPNPQSITRFASAARDEIDALARQLIQTNTAAPPALDASSFTQLALTAESLSLLPFAESLLAAQLTIESIAAQGLSADSAAAELFADLILQLQTATDELEAGDTLASMSDALLTQVGELIALTDSVNAASPKATSADFNPIPADHAATAPGPTVPLASESRIATSVRYEPRNLNGPRVDLRSNLGTTAQSHEQPVPADDTAASKFCTRAANSPDLHNAVQAPSDVPSAATQSGGEFSSTESAGSVGSLTAAIFKDHQVRNQLTSESAHNAALAPFPKTQDISDSPGRLGRDKLCSTPEQDTIQGHVVTSFASVSVPQPVCDKQTLQLNQAFGVEDADQPRHVEQVVQVDNIDNAFGLSSSSQTLFPDARSMSEPALRPAVCLIPAAGLKSTNGHTGRVMIIVDAVTPAAEEMALQYETLLSGAALPDGSNPTNVAAADELTKCSTSPNPLFRDNDPLNDASVPLIVDAKPTTIDENSSTAVVCKPNQESGPDTIFAATSELTSYTTPDTTPNTAFEKIIALTPSHSVDNSVLIPKDGASADDAGVGSADADGQTESDIAIASPQGDVAFPSLTFAQPLMEHSGTEHIAGSLLPLNELAAPPLEVDNLQDASETCNSPATGCIFLAPHAASSDAIVATGVEPVDTGWQQIDADLPMAAGSMGIGFAADGSSPVPKSLDLDALNDRISELLRTSPSPAPGELAPVALLCDPVATASAARNSLQLPYAASADEAASSVAGNHSPNSFELRTATGLDESPAEGANGVEKPSATLPLLPDANPVDQIAAHLAAVGASSFNRESSESDGSDSQRHTVSAAEATLDVGGSVELTPEQMAALMCDGDDSDSGMLASEWGSFPILFTPERTESLQFMVADAKAGIEQLSGAISQLTNFGSRDEAAASITDIAAALDKISDAFNFTSLKIVVGLIYDVAKRSAQVSDALMPEVLVRARAIHSLIEQHIRGLECGMEVKWPLDTLVSRTNRLLSDKPLHPTVRGWHQGDLYRLLELDLVNESFDSPPRPESEDQFVEDGSVWVPTAAATDGETTRTDQSNDSQKKPEVEQIIRVAATTIDSMLDLISQLVLTKNRVFNLSRTMRLPGSQEARFEELTTAADELSTLTGNLQLTMMQARMQPITKLFERYNRVVGDLAGLADKKVNLAVGGQSAMIDKNLFDGLAEAMSQLLRSIVTKQVKLPADRKAQSKPESATITLDAESQGAQIIISIEHDGDMPDHAAIAATAVEKNVCNAEALDTLSDNELFLLAFNPDFGDPQLSKVGTLIADLGGKLGIRVTADGLTRIEIALPLSVAIVPAILVGIGSESYAIPLQSVEEIIRCSDFQASTIHGKPVIRLRDSLLDVVSATSIIGEPATRTAKLIDSTDSVSQINQTGPTDAAEPGPTPVETAQDFSDCLVASDAIAQVKCESNAFGLVLSAGFTRAVLTVDRIIGKQEIVIKKLEGPIANIRCFAGATIRNDGTISLIFDVAEVLKAAS